MNEQMLSIYFPILIFIFMGLIMGIVLIGLGLGLGKLMGHARADSEKQSPYECGFEAFEDCAYEVLMFVIISLPFYLSFLILKLHFCFPGQLHLMLLVWPVFGQ